MGLSLAGLVVGALLGTLVANWLRVDIVPLGVGNFSVCDAFKIAVRLESCFIELLVQISAQDLSLHTNVILLIPYSTAHSGLPVPGGVMHGIRHNYSSSGVALHCLNKKTIKEFSITMAYLFFFTLYWSVPQQGVYSEISYP